MSISTTPSTADPATHGRGTADIGGGGSDTKQAVAEHAEAALETAKDQASDVVRSATDHAKSVANTAKDELRSQGNVQAHRAASSLSGVSDDLRRFADQSTSSAMVRDVARTLADSAHRVSLRLENAGPDGVLDDVARFGRRHPIQFIAIAAASGFAVGRLARSADPSGVRSQMSNGSDTPPALNGGSPQQQSGLGGRTASSAFEQGVPVSAVAPPLETTTSPSTPPPPPPYEGERFPTSDGGL